MQERQGGQAVMKRALSAMSRTHRAELEAMANTHLAEMNALRQEGERATEEAVARCKGGALVRILEKHSPPGPSSFSHYSKLWTGDASMAMSGGARGRGGGGDGCGGGDGGGHRRTAYFKSGEKMRRAGGGAQGGGQPGQVSQAGQFSRRLARARQASFRHAKQQQQQQPGGQPQQQQGEAPAHTIENTRRGRLTMLRRKLHHRHVSTGQLFAEMDADRSDRISFDEFTRGLEMAGVMGHGKEFASVQARAAYDADMRTLFKSFDTDG